MLARVSFAGFYELIKLFGKILCVPLCSLFDVLVIIKYDKSIRYVIKKAVAAGNMREALEVFKIALAQKLLRITLIPQREQGGLRLCRRKELRGLLRGFVAERELHGGRQNGFIERFTPAPLRCRVEGAYGFHDVIKEIDAVGRNIAWAEYVEDLAAACRSGLRFPRRKRARIR